MTQLITIKMVLRRSLKKARALQEIAAYGVSVGFVGALLCRHCAEAAP